MAGKASVKGEARTLILDTAEDLFAHHGVEAVSLRAINAAAGVSPSVLHYHFGNREALVEELVLRRMPELMAQRDAILRPLLRDAEPTLEPIVDSLVSPLAELLAEGEHGARYVRFIARLYADRHPVLEDLSLRFQRTQALYPTLLGRALPALSPAQVGLRLASANHAILQTLADLTAEQRAWLPTGDAGPNLQATLDNLVAFVCGGLRGG